MVLTSVISSPAKIKEIVRDKFSQPLFVSDLEGLAQGLHFGRETVLIMNLDEQPTMQQAVTKIADKVGVKPANSYFIGVISPNALGTLGDSELSLLRPYFDSIAFAISSEHRDAMRAAMGNKSFVSKLFTHSDIYRLISENDLPSFGTIAPAYAQQHLQPKTLGVAAPHGFGGSPLEFQHFHEEPKPEFPDIKGYEILEELGRGGMGVVYKAKNIMMDRVVAIKLMLNLDTESRKRFHREIKVQSQLRHPHILQINSVGTVELLGNENPYIVLEYIEGTSVQDKIEEHGRIENIPAIKITGQIAQALDYGHRQGLVHRDIKPDNILLPQGGPAKLADFGLCKFSGMTILTMDGDVMGTPYYMPPEQAIGFSKKADSRADIYALGATLYHMTCGVPPFAGATNYFEIIGNIVNDNPVPPRMVNSLVTPELERVIIKSMQKDPNNRYQFASDLEADLRELLY